LGGLILAFIVFALPETLKRSKSVALLAEEDAIARIAGSDDLREKGGETNTVRPILARTSTKQSVQVKTSKYLTILRQSFVDPLRIVL
jgi:hypothetical protein